MTVEGALAELVILRDANDVPSYYKGSIKKVIETIVMEFAERKDEPNSSEKPNNSTISKMEQVEEPTEITYQNCSDALLKMWMDNVLTDAEYNRIMDKLNNAQRKDEPQTDKGVSYSDHTDYDGPKIYVTWTEPQTERSE